MSKSLFSLVISVGLLFSASSYAEIVNMKVVGTGTCMPYSADYDPQHSETIVDFGKRLFSKTSAILTNAEGFTKTASVKKIGDTLFSFAGSYHHAKFNVGSCNFIIENSSEQESHGKQVINDENAKDMANVERLEKQLNSLLSKLEAVEKSSTTIANESVVNVASDPIKAAAPTPIVAVNKEQSAPIVERTYANLTPEVKTTIDDWTLEPLSLYHESPILKWERDKSRNAFRVSLKAGKGYKIFYARNNEGQNQYNGKINGYHIINVPYFAHDKIDMRITDAKGNNYNYVIKSLISKNNLDNKPIVVEQDQWKLIKPYGEVQPLVDWKFEKNKNAVLLTLQKGKGYEIVSAKDKDGLNHYKGKVNGAHEITLPYMSDDRIDIEVSDMKSNKYFYQFKPYADIYHAEPVTESKSQNLEPAQKTEVAEVTNERPKVVEVEPKKPEIYQFTLKPGQYLSNELSFFLKKNFNWGLIWNKRTDIQVNSELSTQITDIAQLATWLGEVANLKVMLDPQTNQLIILEN